MDPPEQPRMIDWGILRLLIIHGVVYVFTDKGNEEIHPLSVWVSFAQLHFGRVGRQRESGTGGEIEGGKGIKYYYVVAKEEEVEFMLIPSGRS